MKSMSPEKENEDRSLRLEDVRIRLHGEELLRLDETVLPGDVLTVMGPSGSGKSSLLAYVGGFLAPEFEASGKVFLNGLEITRLSPEERHAGLLFQDALLFPHMSVGENLAFAIPRNSASGRHQRRLLVDEALKEAGLEGMADRDPATLSGGQQSRVAVMRVLLAKPRALLLDEPFSKLDTDLRQQIRQFVFTEAEQHQLPVLLVTHDADDAAAAGGQTVDLAR